MKKAVISTLCAVLVIGFLVLLWMLDIPSWKKLDLNKLTDLNQTTVVYDYLNQPVNSLHAGENRVYISIEEIPEHVRNAFIAIEDIRFYEHPGVDIRRIGGALLNNLKTLSFSEGASTITQQLIKLTHLTSEKKLSRKAQEAWLALQLERVAEKDEILEMYLNVVYFGRSAYGIEAASQSYFGKPCKELTLAEGALLAGIIKAPSAYAPHIHPENALSRRNLVLERMLQAGMVSEEEAEAASKAPVQLIAHALQPAAGWYADWVLKEASDILGCTSDELLSGGYRIYTAVNNEMQSAAEALFENDSYFPPNAPDGNRPESALIAIDPATGEILCLVGGRNYSMRRGLNRAMQIRRQPGSALKPVSVYAAAVDLLGYTPISLIEDRARDFGGGYTPSNASGIEYGTVTMRQALTRSMNLAAVDLITRTGIDAACLYARRAGLPLSAHDRNLSLALGSLTDGVSPAELCAAYAPLTNGGYQVKPHTIRRIEDLYSNTIYEYNGNQAYVMDQKSARMITDMLVDTVESGTARQLSSVGFPVAAKTGTVGLPDGGNRDTWTVAYTPSIVLTIWQGYDQPDSEHLLPNGATGGSYPAKLAAAFLSETAAYADSGRFPVPEGMSEVLIDAYALLQTGAPLLAGERTPTDYLLRELLPDDKLPILTSTLWDDPKPVERVYLDTDASGFPVISFIAPDSYSEYRILRTSGEESSEIGVVSGNAGEYLSYTDQSIADGTDAEYTVISRHIGFKEAGIILESVPSPVITHHAPGLLEKLLEMNLRTNPPISADPLFAANESE